MKKNIPQVAKGGLLDRRLFLQSGATVLTALAGSSAWAGSALSARGFPKTMTTPGHEDDEYGQPSIHEAKVKRSLTRLYESPIFSVSHTPLEDLRGIITPNGLHFGAHHNGIPEIEPETHSLKLHGLVKRPIKWSINDLLRYPMVSKVQFLECSGNSAANAVMDSPVPGRLQDLHGEVSNSEWTGVPLSLLLDEAGVKSKGKWVVCEGADGGSHVRSIPMEKMRDDAIIALNQNGERIRPAQGYPMRLFLPGWEGNASVKWLHRMEVSDRPSQSKDEASLYAEFQKDGRLRQFTFYMEVKSIITHPSGTQKLPDKGLYEISGLAWSGRGKIQAVDVSADGGKTWAPATLQGPVLSKGFTRFTIPWQWNGKPAHLISRARDEYGNTQPTRDEWKSRFASYTFNHYNAMQAWEVTGDGSVNNAYI